MCKIHYKTWFAILAAMSLSAAAGCGDRGLPGPVANTDSAKAIRTAMESASEAGTAEVAVSTGTGWATLRGRFTFDGPPPVMSPYVVTRDPEICSEGGQAPLQETLIVQEGTKGIKNVAVYLRRASRVHESLQEASGELAVFDQKICQFLPHVFATLVGREVQFKNSDPTGHNTKFGSFNDTIPAGTSKTYTHQKELAVPLQVSCSIHPWMTAWFLARSNPYIALTADDGTFEIANLPAGEELEFQVWHESAAGASGSLVPGTAESRELKWTRQGRFKVTLHPDEVKEIPIVVPPSAFKGV